MGLEGRKTAITGAARGLGAALAIVAADQGMMPLLLGRNQARLSEVADVIAQRTGKRPDVMSCDLADPASVANAAERIAATHGDLDILVNSGSQWTGGAFEALTDEQITAMVDSTMTGTRP